MAMETITVSSKGQIVLPIAMRKKLGLTESDRLEVWEKDGLIFMKPVVRLSKLMGRYKVQGKQNATGELRKMREEWDKEFNKELGFGAE